MESEFKIAVLIPCYNEETTISQVVLDARKYLPNAEVYVYDNNSVDNTVSTAQDSGAIVRGVKTKGKGYVIRRMFSDIEADIYIMVDGDATYELSAAPKMVATLLDEYCDMVVGKRIVCDSSNQKNVFRRGHRFGNFIFTRFIVWMFGSAFTDIFSGYRVMSRRFVKSFRSESNQFEIESELAIHSLDLQLNVAEVPTLYYARPEGSNSELRAMKDGCYIFTYIVYLFMGNKPFVFFGAVSILLASSSIVLVIPLLLTYIKTGQVPRLPTAVLSSTLMLGSLVSFVCGVIISSISRTQRLIKRLFYLSIPFARRASSERPD